MVLTNLPFDAPTYSRTQMSFSVLIPVYFKERPDYLDAALDSIWRRQTLKPDEILIVKDGPLTPELDSVIDSYTSEAPVKTLALKTNVGLGTALARGLEACSHDLVARMDADDIATPERFQKQIEYMESHPEIMLLSASIAEFKDTPDVISGHRRVPLRQADILRFARKRNPMNHMAVVFRKSSVLKAGNYQVFHGYEDYFLWVRMLLDGCQCANLDDSLVYARAGNNMIARRQGVKYFKEELRLQNEFLRRRFIHRTDWLKNLAFRVFPRLLPTQALKIIYKLLRS